VVHGNENLVIYGIITSCPANMKQKYKRKRMFISAWKRRYMSDQLEDSSLRRWLPAGDAWNFNLLQPIRGQ
jgi:hypothetical protein